MAIKHMLVASAALIAAPALADVVTFERATAPPPVYNRPLEDLTGLSAVGTATAYDTIGFTVSAAGTYSFVSVGVFDTFAGLYQTSFNPASPLTNAIIYNDDLVSFDSSGFTAALTPGTQYFAVMTGFANTDFGTYAGTIGGPGVISPIASTANSPNVLVLTGDTIGSPTFNRPLEDLSGLSLVGTATRYDLIDFTVDASGEYSFTVTGTFDTFFGLYQSPFNPASPLTGALVYNDDSAGFNASAFSATLTAGMNYQALITSFSNADFGSYAFNAAGPGAIRVANAVPEPASWALMIIGFGTVGLATRRRRAPVMPLRRT